MKQDRPPATTPEGHNEWRETVRDIYDEMHFGENAFFEGNPLAARIIKMIEDRHPGYFNEPHTKERADG